MKRKLNNEVKEIWNTNAAFWDKRMGEGNDFHRLLVEPGQLEMLDIKKGDLILDIACGNGQFARRIKIDYRVIDVTSKAALTKLRGNTYDSIVCTMAIMDIENIEPMISFLPEILNNNGRFVFSILHPCFNSGEASQVNEHTDYGGKIHNTYYVKIADYLISRPVLGIAISGQPEPQYYFHRPLSEILNLCFKHGLYMDGIREPSFKDIEKTSTWGNVFKNNPPAIVCGFKLIK